MNLKSVNYKAAAVAAVAVILISAFGAKAQRGQSEVSVAGRDVTILVTAHPHNDRTRVEATKLRSEDFAVREQKRPQRIISVKKASEAPPILAVLIQDDLASRVNNEIKGLKELIRDLPEGARVMTGYLTVGDLSVAQDFTSDRERAADSLRIVRGTAGASPYNPYVGLIRALKRFDSQPSGRRMVLIVSDGLDASQGLRSASPTLSIDLNRAIREAQRRGVAVFSIYAPSVGLTGSNHLAYNYGQGSLNRLADETGGELFSTGTDFVTFSPYLKEMNELLGLQWLITYRSTTPGTSFRRIEVSTDADVHLHYQAGYRLR